MTDSHDLAARFAILKVIASRLGDAKKVSDCEIRDTWRTGDRNTACLPDGTKVGTVTLAKGRAVAKITDEKAYEEWVAETHPDEFETVTITRVRPAFTERLMSAARQIGVAIDTTTGEEVPGIRVEEGEPCPTTRLNADALALVAAAWQAGQLAELVGALLRPEVEGGGS